MGFKCGIVGLPNVGKSTLFNALTQTAAAQAANYPFCTIEPNVGDVAVPEPRLQKLAEVAGSKEVIPARMNFVDIAGLVAGASKGEGLGNQFLANIRETDAIAYVLRCFDDDDVTHVNNRIDPLADLETVETELMLADLESLEKRKANLEKKAKTGDKEAKTQLGLIDIALEQLNSGRPARFAEIAKDDRKAWRGLQLLTTKPVLFIANVDEESAATGNAYSEIVFKRAAEEGAQALDGQARLDGGPDGPGHHHEREAEHVEQRERRVDARDVQLVARQDVQGEGRDGDDRGHDGKDAAAHDARELVLPQRRELELAAAVQ